MLDKGNKTCYTKDNERGKTMKNYCEVCSEELDETEVLLCNICYGTIEDDEYVMRIPSLLDSDDFVEDDLPW